MAVRHEPGRGLESPAAVVHVDGHEARVLARADRDERHPLDGRGKLLEGQRKLGARDDQALDTTLEHEPQVREFVVLSLALDAGDDQVIPALTRL